MFVRKDSEISPLGHVLPSGEGDVTGWKRHQKLVAEIKPGNCFCNKFESLCVCVCVCVCASVCGGEEEGVL